MKTNTFRNKAVAFALAASLPASAQTAAQLKQENARLKAQIEALQAQGCQPSRSAGNDWNQDGVSARIDAIRPGLNNHGDARITVTVTLRNTTARPIVLNYKSRSFSLVDDVGYEYSTHAYGGSVKGIPTADSTADTTAVIGAGASRTVTFIAARGMNRGQSMGGRFDMNATFIQVEDLGQGQVRKVRDFAIAFTNVPASRP